QVAGRAARNIEGLVILYGDKITKAMQYLIDTTKERRKVQTEFNKINGITPRTIYKSIDDIMISTSVADSIREKEDVYVPGYDKAHIPEAEKQMILIELRKAMLEAAEKYEFEKAVKIRDEIEEFEKDLGIAIS
ncbi:MAG: excinuclease ABC subunit B, partial [Candidatus Marinimicrobia bacterium]|nr:excinuclease ABC subunit B [Candidatus Neomarinimicrobiota bacterium]